MNMTTMTHEDSMREMIINSIKSGLADSKAGRGEVLTDSYVAKLKKKLIIRINKKHKAE